MLSVYSFVSANSTIDTNKKAQREAICSIQQEKIRWKKHSSFYIKGQVVWKAVRV
jgi:hypothetical protein